VEFKDLSVLCVEDDEKTLFIYESLFKIIFKEVFLAKNGEDALKIFENNKIDIIITDQNMPVMNGIDMSKKIREKDFDIPIILVTALENLEMLKEALNINVTAFIRKPLQKDVLISKLKLIASSVLAQRYTLQSQKKIIEYSTYQEKLAYKKEAKISKIYKDKIKDYNIEYIYRPKDILAGDGFLVKKNFIFLMDAMGKGVSASITSSVATSFVDFLIDEYSNLREIIKRFISHMRKFLLDEEILSCAFYEFAKESINYAMFSMPPMLSVKNGELKIFKSNNFAIYLDTQEFKIDKTDIKNEKILIFSDGLSEAVYNNSLYFPQLKKNFLEFENINSLKNKLTELEIRDDLTILFLKDTSG
jgi:CheY-like chemotaxis protein